MLYAMRHACFVSNRSQSSDPPNADSISAFWPRSESKSCLLRFLAPLPWSILQFDLRRGFGDRVDVLKAGGAGIVPIQEYLPGDMLPCKLVFGAALSRSARPKSFANSETGAVCQSFGEIVADWLEDRHKSSQPFGKPGMLARPFGPVKWVRSWAAKHDVG